MQAIIVDIDGTLAHKHHGRDIYDLTKVGLDDPIWPTIRVVNSMMRDYQVIFVSGRKEACRQETESWLNLWVMHLLRLSPLMLFMRQDTDNRDDAIIKREIYEQYIKDKYDVFCVFDDRRKVIDMWRSLGLFVFNCSQLEDNDF